MMRNALVVGGFLVALCLSTAAADQPAGEDRNKKLIPLFQVVKFSNDVCVSDNRNGTCYTSSECSSRGGTAGTSCASGFGVCCTFVLSCGNSTSENNSYLIQAASTTLTSACTYEICRIDSSVCRIKYDFTAMVLATPQVGTTAETAPTGTHGGSVGDCTTDTFTITNPGKISPPTICGTNSGQHMILDATSSCQAVTINLGSSDTTTSRSWTIVVSQYTCAEETISGAPGCLQYFTGTTGRFASFGVNTAVAVAANTADVTHLSNQNYDICIRRESSYCYICYFTSINGIASTPANQASFGLSLTAAAIASSVVGSECSQDYISIPGGQAMAVAAAAITTTSGANTNSRFCGRSLNTQNNEAVGNVSVCSRVTPFTVSVSFDGDEVDAAIAEAKSAEMNKAPGGILGFDLNYVQSTSTTCT